MKQRKVENIDVGLYENKVGMSLKYEGQEDKEHILFATEVAISLAREMIALATVLRNQGFQDAIRVKENVKVEIH